MRKYEMLLLLSPELNVENKKAVIDGLTTIIVDREQGTMLSVDDWGTRELAYPVRKQIRGQYVRLEFAAPAKTIAEVERNVRITDGIFKFVTVKLADKYVPAAPVEAVAPEAAAPEAPATPAAPEAAASDAPEA